LRTTGSLIPNAVAQRDRRELAAASVAAAARADIAAVFATMQEATLDECVQELAAHGLVEVPEPSRLIAS
jgi:hypothetical protein